MGSDIPSYQPINTPENYQPDRARPLLLHKKEIAYLEGKIHDKKCHNRENPLKNNNFNDFDYDSPSLGALNEGRPRHELVLFEYSDFARSKTLIRKRLLA